MKGNKIIEIKPNTPTGRKSGEIRKKLLEEYLDAEVEIYYYNPADY